MIREIRTVTLRRHLRSVIIFWSCHRQYFRPGRTIFSGDAAMNRTLFFLLVTAAASLGLTACIFAVDTDMEDGETPDVGPGDVAEPEVDTDEPPDTSPDPDTDDVDIDADGDADTDPPPDYSLTVTGPDEPLTVAPTELDHTLEYDLQCEPEGCEALFHCRLAGDDPPIYAPCNSPFEVDVEDVGEGPHTVEAALIDTDDTVHAEDQNSTVVFFELEASIAGLDAEEPTEFSHPFPGDFTIDCPHPHCDVACQWVDSDSDPDCSTEEPFPLRIPEEPGADVTLEFQACSTTDFGEEIDHCVHTTYDFAYTAPRWTAIEPGFTHTCGILDDDSLWCWGADSLDISDPESEGGRLGLGSDATSIEHFPRHVTVEDDSNPGWKTVSISISHSCAIRIDGALYCWGDNEFGGVDPGGPDEAYDTPTLLDDNHTWETVAVGMRFGCATTDEGKLYCWGSNINGKLGVGENPAEDDLNLVELPDEEDEEDLDPVAWTQVGVGFQHACALVENAVQEQSTIGPYVPYCWGFATDGRVGVYDPDDEYDTPQLVDNPVRAQKTEFLSVGDSHACTLTHTNTPPDALCWGNNNEGQLGWEDGEERDGPWFVESSGGFSAADVAAGGGHSCALDLDRQPWCWGNNEFYQLGTGDDEPAPQPVEVDFSGQAENGISLETISTGSAHTCAISEDLEGLYCWGHGEAGKLGTGVTENATTPLPVYWSHTR